MHHLLERNHGIENTEKPKVIAKAIRKDIREAVEVGLLPKGIKCSVTSDFNSIRVIIMEMPEHFPVMHPEFVQWYKDCVAKDFRNTGPSPEHRYTMGARNVLQTVKDLVSFYNWNNDEPETDYFHSNFFQEVDFHANVERLEDLKGPGRGVPHFDPGFSFDETPQAPEVAEEAPEVAEEAPEVAEEAPEVCKVVQLHPEHQDWTVVGADLHETEYWDEELESAKCYLEEAQAVLANAQKKVEIARIRAEASQLMAEAARLLEEAGLNELEL